VLIIAKTARKEINKMGRIIIKDLPKDMTISRRDLRRITGGGVTVGVNSLSVVHKSSSAVTMAFPDVCKTPTPGGPVPIPYPNIGSSSDTSSGSKTVKISGSEICLKGSEYEMSESDE
jgi:hypothetical protein